MTYKNCSKRNKDRKARVLSTLFVLSVAGLLFFIILNVADFISSSLMNRSSIFYGGNVRTNSYVMYGMCFYQVSGKNEADALSKSIQSQGGAGYVNQQGDYFVYASMYASFADAGSVRDKLGGSANIVNISIPAINIKANGNAEDIVAAIGDFRKIYDTLYQISIDYDQGAVDASGAKSNIEACSALVQQNFDRIAAINDDKVKLVADFLNKTLERLKTLVQRQYWALEFNSAIKYAYFEAIFNNIALAKAL